MKSLKVDKSVKTIEWPKNPKECLKFTNDGGLAIIGERKNYKDAISIISLRTVFKLLPNSRLAIFSQSEKEFFEKLSKGNGL